MGNRPTSSSNGWRVRAAAALVLMFAVGSCAQWIGKAVWNLEAVRAEDEVSAYERRLAPLRTHLPRHAVVGYLSDPEPEGLPRAQSREHYRKFLLTRYSLVPVLVVRTTTPELVVGNFDDPSHADQAERLGLEAVSRFDGGVVLFRRAAR